MNNKKYDLALLVIGIICVISPLPMFFVAILWCWLWAFGIGMGLLGYTTIPDWIMSISLLALFVSPVLELLAIIIGIVKRKQRYSLACIILSLLGLLFNAALLYVMYYLGSHF